MRSAGKALSPALMMAIVALQAAKMPRIDKTAYWINGIMCSLWVSCDPQRNIAAYRVGRAGDTDVVERVLGAWNGIVICDGARVFKRFARIQRCRAHVLKKARYPARVYPDSPGARHVLARPGATFADAKRSGGGAAARRNKRHEFARRVRTLARQHMDDPGLRRFMVTLGNAASGLFPFVVDPEVPPTNNAAERLLREPVVLRKMRGGLRAAASMLVMSALPTCRTTWELQGPGWRAEIARRIWRGPLPPPRDSACRKRRQLP